MLGEQPAERHGSELSHRAARGLARYRLEEDVTDTRSALGEPPSDPAKAERYEQAHATLDRVRRRLGTDAGEREPSGPLQLPAAYVRLFGEDRSAGLDHPLAAEDERVRHFNEEELHSLVGRGDEVLAQLDHRAAHQVLRLEQEHHHHRETARKQSDRAERLEAEADKLGWRARSERNQLRHDAALHRAHVARHAADADRTELQLGRLREAGRHPDHWLAENATHLAAHIAASAELERRHEQEVNRQAELAIAAPPLCVGELIGERPISGVRLAREWEEIARQIERHRLSYGLDDDAEAVLSAETPHIEPRKRGPYEEERQRLAEQIERYRQECHLPELDAGRELAGDTRSDLGRER